MEKCTTMSLSLRFAQATPYPPKTRYPSQKLRQFLNACNMAMPKDRSAVDVHRRCGAGTMGDKFPTFQ